MMYALPAAMGNVSLSAVAIGCVTLAFSVFWPRRYQRLLPNTLAGLISGTLLGVLWLNDAPVVGEVPTGLPTPQLVLPSLDFLARAVEPAIMLALVGSVVSLLTCLVADSLTRTTHDPDRELIGQGIGNAAAGLIGALPGAGTPVYTVPNIRAGGTTRAAGAIFALFLLALLFGLAPLVEAIPLAALAAVLMKVGWDLVDWHILTRLNRIRRDQLVVMLMTLALAVFVDLITAVAVGLVASALARTGQLEQLEHDSVVSVPLLDQMFLYQGEDVEGADPFSAQVGMVRLTGSLTVTSSRKLVKTISHDLKDHEVVVFDFLRRQLHRRQRRNALQATHRNRRGRAYPGDRNGPFGRCRGDPRGPRRAATGAAGTNRRRHRRGAAGREKASGPRNVAEPDPRYRSLTPDNHGSADARTVAECRDPEINRN